MLHNILHILISNYINYYNIKYQFTTYTCISKSLSTFAKQNILKQIYHTLNNCKYFKLNLPPISSCKLLVWKKRYLGRTKYIDQITINDIKSQKPAHINIAIGCDNYNRYFITIYDRYDIGVITIFQRYSDTQINWVYGTDYYFPSYKLYGDCCMINKWHKIQDIVDNVSTTTPTFTNDIQINKFISIIINAYNIAYKNDKIIQ